jgi:hypothetical protein
MFSCQEYTSGRAYFSASNNDPTEYAADVGITALD